MPVIRLRFVKGKGLAALAIIAQEKTAMPLTPSHVEAIIATGQGLGYVGSHIQDGMRWRPLDYDKGDFTDELILELPASDDQVTAFNAFMLSIIGEAYDWQAIFGFVIPEHFHIPHHVICSAAVTLGLRKCGWFPWPLAAPAHLISPRDLLVMISGRMQVPGI